jgi:hypothetical protein
MLGSGFDREQADYGIDGSQVAASLFRSLLIGADRVLYLGLLAAKGGQNLWISHEAAVN